MAILINWLSIDWYLKVLEIVVCEKLICYDLLSNLSGQWNDNVPLLVMIFITLLIQYLPKYKISSNASWPVLTIAISANALVKLWFIYMLLLVTNTYIFEQLYQLGCVCVLLCFDPIFTLWNCMKVVSYIVEQIQWLIFQKTLGFGLPLSRNVSLQWGIWWQRLNYFIPPGHRPQPVGLNPNTSRNLSIGWYNGLLIL